MRHFRPLLGVRHRVSGSWVWSLRWWCRRSGVQPRARRDARARLLDRAERESAGARDRLGARRGVPERDELCRRRLVPWLAPVGRPPPGRRRFERRQLVDRPRTGTAVNREFPRAARGRRVRDRHALLRGGCVPPGPGSDQQDVDRAVERLGLDGRAQPQSGAPPGEPAVRNRVPDEHDLFAVGSAFSHTLVRKTLVEHWDGHTWSIVPSPSANRSSTLLHVSCASDSSCFAVGSSIVTRVAHQDAGGMLDRHGVVDRRERQRARRGLEHARRRLVHEHRRVLCGRRVEGHARRLCERIGGALERVPLVDIVALCGCPDWRSAQPPVRYRVPGGDELLRGLGFFYLVDNLSATALVEHWDGASWSLVASPALDAGYRPSSWISCASVLELRWLQRGAHREVGRHRLGDRSGWWIAKRSHGRGLLEHDAVLRSRRPDRLLRGHLRRAAVSARAMGRHEVDRRTGCGAARRRRAPPLFRCLPGSHESLRRRYLRARRLGSQGIARALGRYGLVDRPEPRLPRHFVRGALGYLVFVAHELLRGRGVRQPRLDRAVGRHRLGDRREPDTFGFVRRSAHGACLCSSSTGCIAVGVGGSPRSGVVLVERWAGSHWSIIAGPAIAGRLTGIACWSDTNRFVVDDGGYDRTMERTNWSVLVFATRGFHPLTGISCSKLHELHCGRGFRRFH